MSEWKQYCGGVNDLKTVVVREGWANVEAAVTLVGPGLSCAGYVVDYNRATNWAKGWAIEDEEAIVVFPSGHGGGDGGLMENVESEPGLWEELAPKS